jgi:glycosyltransferase involved in cell wall biosynthesis
LGLRGKILPVFPNTGGYDLKHCQTLRLPGHPSTRRVILLKGYQHWAGRALVGLRALARCAELIKSDGYELAIYSASPDVKIAAELFEQETGVPTRLIPKSSHTEMLQWYGRARIYLGLSISDAISTSLLEALVMGAFPIQSCTACANEWIEDGKSGLIVPPEDPDLIAAAIRRALTEPDLVDQAAEINALTAQVRLNYSTIQREVVNMYQEILNSRRE